MEHALESYNILNGIKPKKYKTQFPYTNDIDTKVIFSKEKVLIFAKSYDKYEKKGDKNAVSKVSAREKVVDAKSNVKKIENAVSAREKVVDAKSNAVSAREKVVDAKSNEVSVREKVVDAKSNEVSAREKVDKSIDKPIELQVVRKPYLGKKPLLPWMKPELVIPNTNQVNTSPTISGGYMADIIFIE
jgi:hypothetical protein